MPETSTSSKNERHADPGSVPAVMASVARSTTGVARPASIAELDANRNGGHVQGKSGLLVPMWRSTTNMTLEAEAEEAEEAAVEVAFSMFLVQSLAPFRMVWFLNS